MHVPSDRPMPTCPDPLARAPRAPRPAPGHADGAGERLILAPAALQGVMAALVCRDTRGLPLSDAQRLTHFPASPLVTLSWFNDMDVGLVGDAGSAARWRPFRARVMIAGSQSRPLVSWAPNTGRGYIACFTADVARLLFEVEPATIHDRFLPAQEVFSDRWQPMCEALVNAADDATTVAALEAHLGARWRALHGRSSPLPSLRQLGRHWVEQLSWKALEWGRGHSPRQVERRIKSFSGRSLRQWRALTKTEGVFFAARDRHAHGLPIDWAELALQEGFADQSHLSRAAKKLTGFPPGEFAQRFLEDESFWLYRLWV